MTIWTSDFWRAAIERSVKTFAQTAAALAVGSGAGLIDTDWLTLASVSGMAALVSLLTSVGSDALTGGGPSLTSAEVVAGTVSVTAPADAPTTVTAEVDMTRAPQILGKAWTSGFSAEAEDARAARRAEEGDPNRP